jgi:transcriptional regulator with XRE-family HTH domain
VTEREVFFISEEQSGNGKLSTTIAKNLVYYRRQRGLTQSELAALINYSDKSVSKWERAGGTPDVFLLSRLAELYGVTVNDFLIETPASAGMPVAPGNRSRVVVFLQILVCVWLAATLAFTFWKLIFPEIPYAWITFVVAVPASAAAFVVASALWWGPKLLFISVSALAWTSAACVYLFLSELRYAWLLFIVCGVAQLFILLWFVRIVLAARAKKRVRLED